MGKSTIVSIVSDMFCQQEEPNIQSSQDHPSVRIIDCDIIAREVVEPGRWGYKRVVASFSGMENCRSKNPFGIIQDDGSLDRDSLGTLVFSNPVARKKLQRALHLPIFVELVSKIFSYWWSGSCDIILIDMPLLFETKFYLLTKPYNILVTCSEREQVHRLANRDGLSREEALQRVHAQMPVAEKSSMAEYVVCNEYITLEDLRERISSVITTILSDKSKVQSFRLLVFASLLLALPLLSLVTLTVLIFAHI